MRRAVWVAMAMFVGVAPRAALARRGVRPLFEPTDLELEDPGDAELDLQVGLVRSQGPWRLVLPDFEADLGVMPYLEIDIDGAYAITARQPGTLKFEDAAPDTLWLAAKVGIFDWADDGAAPGETIVHPERRVAWAIGMQLGPKLPVAPGSHGVGLETLVLVARVQGRSRFVLNTGGFVDPSPELGMTRPKGIELGIDFGRDLDARGWFQVTAELAGVRFVSSDPNQLLATAGLAWSPTADTQLALVALWGFLDGSDRYGALLGVSQRLRFSRLARAAATRAGP